MRKDGIIFREVQAFRQWWAWILILAGAGIGWAGFIYQIILGRPFGNNPATDSSVMVLFVIFGVLFPLIFYIFRLITEVSQEYIRIRFFPVFSRRIKLSDVEKVIIRRYNPIREYGGWGIRYGGKGKKGWAYTVSGNLGVEIILKDGRSLLIGSKMPDKLALAIAEATNLSES